MDKITIEVPEEELLDTSKRIRKAIYDLETACKAAATRDLSISILVEGIIWETKGGGEIRINAGKPGEFKIWVNSIIKEVRY